LSLTDILLHHSERFGDRAALEYEGTDTSWASLLAGTRETAGALAEAGVERGDVVAVLLHNSDRMIELMHAISHLGAIFMPLNWRLAGPEIAYIANHAGAAVLVTEPELEEIVDPGAADLDCRRLHVAGESSAQAQSLDELRAEGRARIDAAAVADDDVQRLMYTSGTTARPKGVMITYANIEAKNVSHMVEFGITAADVGLACGPLYHVGALDLTTTTLMYAGATTHVQRRFDAAAVLDGIEAHRVSQIWLAPAMINAIVAEPELDRRDLNSVRLIIDGGEKMPMPLIERVLDAFPNAWFSDAYGLTETVSGDTFLDKGHTRKKLGSVGKPVIHTEVRVVDPDDRPLPAGETGEIVLRGPKVCKGYWRDKEATARAMRGGWFHTGDVGLLDSDGFLFIVDRLKDMILSGGENVASSEVERVLYEHERVVEAAVVGRPDPRWGEVPVAYVAMREPGEEPLEELTAHCRERLARYKVPKLFRVVEELPRNPTGKVLKRVLRDRERSESEQGAAPEEAEQQSATGAAAGPRAD
jgi:fatty-acyl-CoA synthase